MVNARIACYICLLEFDNQSFRFEFLFFSFLPSSLPILVCIRVHISLHFVVLKISHPLQIIAVFFSSPLTHMPVDVIKTCFFYNSQTSTQLLIIVLNKIPPFM